MYIAVADVKQVMRNLPSASKLADTDIEFFIESAQSQVDSFLAEVYSVPFLVVPPIIKKVTLDLAVYHLTESLYTSYQPNQQDGNQVRYDRSMEVLKQVRNGDIKFIGVEPIKPFDSIGFASTFEGELFFTIDTDKEW